MKIQQDATVYQNFISYLYEALNMFRAITAHHQKPKTALALHVQQPSTFAIPEAASAVLGS
jgi:hypothetical protein